MIATSRDRFKSVARYPTLQRHPHICQIYDVGPDYLVHEYVEGTPVRGPLSLTLAYVGLGDREKTLDWLEKGLETGGMLPVLAGAGPLIRTSWVIERGGKRWPFSLLARSQFTDCQPAAKAGQHFAVAQDRPSPTAVRPL